VPSRIESALKSLRFRAIRRFKVALVRNMKSLLDLAGVAHFPVLLRVYLKFWEKSLLFRKLSWLNEFREIVDYLQIDDPLSELASEKLTIVIMCHPKDIDLLNESIKGAIMSVRNVLEEIVVVSPEPIDVDYFDTEVPIRNLLDAEILAWNSNSVQDQKFLEGQRTWILQQVLKIKTALLLERDYLLILDSDTILSSRRKFVCESKQLLFFSYEYHSPYIRHYKKFQPSQGEVGLSFVTHHQIWQADIVKEIWGGTGLFDWLESADSNHPNSVSEYHTYGTYIFNAHPSRFTWARWGNIPISKKLHQLAANSGRQIQPSVQERANSISLHAYS